MTCYVVDVCITIKWFIPEIFSEEATQLLSPDYDLIAPDYFLIEAANILWKKTRRNEINLEDAHQILAALPNSPIQSRDTHSFLYAAFDLSHQTGRSLYDCLYLYLAIQEKCQMVTADEKLYNGLKNTEWSRYLLWVENFSP